MTVHTALLNARCQELEDLLEHLLRGNAHIEVVRCHGSGKLRLVVTLGALRLGRLGFCMWVSRGGKGRRDRPRGTAQVGGRASVGQMSKGSGAEAMRALGGDCAPAPQSFSWYGL